MVMDGFIKVVFTWPPVNFVLRPVVKPMNPGEVAFGEQLRLGLQPVLHIAPGPRTLVQITEVSPSGHFVR